MSIPVGATHQWLANGLYAKRSGDHGCFAVWNYGQWLWIGDEFNGPMIELKKPTWSGPQDGLPPVGFRCEAGIPHTSGPDNEVSIIWIEGRVIAYFEVKGNTYAWFAEDDGFYPPAVLEFRAIKTPDQLAAEQRETAVREFMDIVGIDCRVTAGKAVDAGFKREVV